MIAMVAGALFSFAGAVDAFAVTVIFALVDVALSFDLAVVLNLQIAAFQFLLMDQLLARHACGRVVELSLLLLGELLSLGLVPGLHVAHLLFLSLPQLIAGQRRSAIVIRRFSAGVFREAIIEDGDFAIICGRLMKIANI
ncbi:MAG TPA: hypothetical protein VG711_00330, partial [Phycisphaerales bacterium]|nr:hypothetical protein [Phycisphaerales bacterium]